MASSLHSQQTPTDGIHVIHAWVYANQVNRLAHTPASGSLTALTAADQGKISKEFDTNTYWVLKNHSPVTWAQLDTSGSVPTSHAPSHILSGSDEIDGDKLGIDFTPSNYFPNTSPSEVTDANHLSAHLKGIDLILSGVDKYQQVVTVAKAGGDFPTISGALASINDSSTSKRYLLQIYPGDYTENNPLTTTPYTSIDAPGRHEATRMICANSGSHGLITTSDIDITGLQVKNASGSGSAAFYVPPGVVDVDFHDCKARDCDIGLLNESTGEAIICREFNITGGTMTSGIKSSTGASTRVSDVNVTADVTLGSLFVADGENAIIDASEISLIGTLTTNAVFADNGGEIRVGNSRFDGMVNGLRVGTGGGTINATSVDIVNETGNSILTETSASSIAINGGLLNELSVIRAAGDSVDGSVNSLTPGSEGLNLIRNLHVGSQPEPRTSHFGEGPSHVRGMVVFTTDLTASPSSDGAGFSDVSTAAASISGSTYTFQGTSAGHSILFCTTLEKDGTPLKHWGLSISQTIAAVEVTPKSFIHEIWNGSAWVEIGTMSVGMPASYRYGNEHYIRANTLEQLNYGITDVTTWSTKTINSITGYWSRVRIITSLTTSPVFQQAKLITNHSMKTSDGTDIYHGSSRFRRQVFSGGNMFGESGGVSAFSFNVGSGTLPNSWSHQVKNSNLNGNGDALYFQHSIPRGTDTSFPFRYVVSYLSNNFSTGSGAAVNTRMSFKPSEQAGILKADPSGGSTPVNRTYANTEAFTSASAGQVVSGTIDTVDITKSGIIEFDGFDVSNHYEGDMAYVRFEMTDDGPGNVKLGILTIDLEAVAWTHGEKL